VSRLKKLVDQVRNNPKDVRFDDACWLAERLGFNAHAQSGSHCAYSKTGERTGLNFQNKQGRIPPYQARQLIEMINAYYEDDDGPQEKPHKDHKDVS
jgi:hypothetical protein